jgi:hypothetical protein
MDNKVGDNMPSAKAFAALLQQLKDVVEQLKKFGITLSGDERKRLLHARREADPMVKRVHDLAVKYNIAIPKIPLQGMTNDMLLREHMQPIVDELRAGLTVAEDTEGEAESEMWEAFLAYYGVLANMAPRMPELATELAPVVTFMSNKRRTPDAGGSPPPGGGSPG